MGVAVRWHRQTGIDRVGPLAGGIELESIGIDGPIQRRSGTRTEPSEWISAVSGARSRPEETQAVDVPTLGY